MYRVRYVYTEVQYRKAKSRTASGLVAYNPCFREEFDQTSWIPESISGILYRFPEVQSGILKELDSGNSVRSQIPWLQSCQGFQSGSALR